MKEGKYTIPKEFHDKKIAEQVKRIKKGKIMHSIKNCKIKYITEKEAKELCEDMHFCPACYPLYSIGIVLYDGEIGYHPFTDTRYVIKKEGNMKHATLNEAVIKMEKRKTLTEWFNGLSLKDKIKLHHYHIEQELELINNLFEPEESRDSQVGGTE